VCWPIFIERARDTERERERESTRKRKRKRSHGLLKLEIFNSDVSKKIKKIVNPEVLAYFHRESKREIERERERERE
jgi:hypothetical protein